MGSLICGGLFNIQKILNEVTIVEEKMRGKKVSGGNQKKKSLATDPTTPFRYKD